MEETYRSSFNYGTNNRMIQSASLFELPPRRTSQLTDISVQSQRFKHKDRFSTGVIEFNNPAPGKYEVTRDMKNEKGKSIGLGRE